MTENVLITAFFDIGRDKFKEIPRSAEKYFDYFKRWARIKNDIIFFCESEIHAKKVIEIRNDFGLKDKTKTVVLDDITKIAPDLYEKMKKIESDEFFLNFRLNRFATENSATYNYVMLMKFYSIFQASLMVGDEVKFLTWFDFGFEHGGGTFADENDYSFEWKYNFDEKITLFYRNKIDTRPMFEIVRTIHPESFMGSPFVVYKPIAEKFWQLILSLATQLANIGLIDDDQPFLLFAYRTKPDWFSIHKSDWFLPIKEFGGEHFKLKEKPKINFLQKVKNKLGKLKRIVFKKKR